MGNRTAYEKKAQEIRHLTLSIAHSGQASHIGSALSIADLLAVLYGGILRISPQQLDAPFRDRFILSKGHAAAGYYAALAVYGFITPSELQNGYGKNNSIFLSHASHLVPGVEFSTGSLGHGLALGCGLALAAHRDEAPFRTYVMISDGELNEGSIWESLLFAPHHRLTSLTLLIDYNKIQSFGHVKDVLALEPLADKLNAFGWSVREIDGHNVEEIERALLAPSQAPKAIIAHTIKGKGVSFMENQLLWHYKSLSDEEYQRAIREIIA